MNEKIQQKLLFIDAYEDDPKWRSELLWGWNFDVLDGMFKK